MKLTCGMNCMNGRWTATIETPDMQRVSAQGNTELEARAALWRLVTAMASEVRM